LIPRQARLAVLCSFLFHGALILAGRYRLSYDAYIHMFFGDHYRMDWWSLWEPRWYSGFYVNSYPPLVHQLIGAFSHLVGLDAAFALLLWTTVSALPLAVYAFARIFVGRASAGYAALGAAFLPSVYLTAHIFGQLPTLAATVTALFGMAVLSQFLRHGNRLDGILAIALFSTVMALHHGILLLLPWLVLAVVAHQLGAAKVGWQTLLARLLIVGSLSLVAMLLVIWPFWDWGRAQVIQTPIDHASRHNFFKDPFASLIFFLPMYGPLVIFIPAALSLARRRRLVSLGFAFGILFVLGLGGTTPLPALFFGKGWEWLTYDRFALWASLTLLPFFGIRVIALRRQRSRNVSIKIFATLATTCLIVGLVTAFLPLQPGAVDMKQVVNFLKQDDYSAWRYLTFGFGDQLALLSTLTTATTIDGSYHTARTLPELRTSGIGQIDTAYWLPNGLSALDPILQKAGERGVRWGFVNIPQYIPVLERNGWGKLETLPGGVQVWENPNAVLSPPGPAPAMDDLASFSWGTLPIISLLTSLSLGALRIWGTQAEGVLHRVYGFIVACIPLSLGFWYYTTIHEFRSARIYFTYTDTLFFLSDALVSFAILIWLSTKIAQPHNLPSSSYETKPLHSSVKFLPALFFLLSLASTLWSRNWRISLYFSLHILLVLLFVLSLRDWQAIWRFSLPGFCAALSIQLVAGLIGFTTQSTAFLAPLGLQWPGTIGPSTPGAVIVQLPDGAAFLRAYGTLPHPNILGGFTLILLLGPVALFMRRDNPNYAALLLLAPGIALLALSFSRAAWLALIVFCLVLILKSKYVDRKRLLVLLAVIALSFVLTLISQRSLVQARTIRGTSHAEQFSLIGRAWLNGEALKMIREHPFTGVGSGSFLLELARNAGEGYVIEPAHNVPLLAGAELGIPGLLLVMGSVVWFDYRLLKTRSPNAILAGATLTGLAVISLFDHYLWTLAPGRLMLGLLIGLFAGQEAIHET
jgi:hypothetical protein